MKLRLNKTGEVFDEKRGVGLALIEARVCSEVIPPKKPDTPLKIEFFVEPYNPRGATSDSSPQIPSIRMTCSKCNKTFRRISPEVKVGLRQICHGLDATRNGPQPKYQAGDLAWDSIISSRDNAVNAATSWEVFHCGVTTTVPKDVVSEFVALFKTLDKEKAKRMNGKPEKPTFMPPIPVPNRDEVHYSKSDPSRPHDDELNVFTQICE